MKFAPILNLLLAAVTLAAPLQKQAENVRNDVVDGICKPVTVIYARGTGEDGNVGGQIGTTFFEALTNILGEDNVAVQGVNDYPADELGYFLGGSDEGAIYMAKIAAQAVEQCPTTQLVLSGYSQGAQVTHKAAGLLSEAVIERVAAVVVFGDPDKVLPFPEPLDTREITFCNSADLICDGIPIVKDAHRTYAKDASAAAEFVTERLAIRSVEALEEKAEGADSE